MEVLGARMLYCDTDSVIYVRVPGMPDLVYGEMLGQWKSELDAGDHGIEFCISRSQKLWLPNLTRKDGIESQRVFP